MFSASIGISVDRLVALHVDSLYVVEGRACLRATNDFDLERPPRLSLVRSSAGNRCLLAHDLPAALRADLAALAATEPCESEPARWPRHRARYREVLEAAVGACREYAGPAFVLPPRACDAGNSARILRADEHELLLPHFGWLIEELPRAEPVAAVERDGAVVSLCRGARRRGLAVEAGVETVPAHRGHGFARDATARWAEALHARGTLPLYSTSWDNAASARIAAALGASCYAVDFSLV